jgi:hypothetical protein
MKKAKRRRKGESPHYVAASIWRMEFGGTMLEAHHDTAAQKLLHARP